MIEHKGYTAVVEFDPSIDAFHGRVLGLQDVVTFEGRSVDELLREMVESVEDYLDFCAEQGKEPERPYRGEFLVRTTPEVHRAVATAAAAEGVSLNTWVESTLTAVAAQSRTTRTRTSKAPLVTTGRPAEPAATRKGRSRSPRKDR
jgi:predicted HicB family RNase H-like nuclease